MYINGVTTYNKDGKPQKTGLISGLVTQDGELCITKNGNTYGRTSIRAFGRSDGSTAFLTVKSFDETIARQLSGLRKGDRILATGLIDSREYNGKTYTDLLVDYLQSPVPAHGSAFSESDQSTTSDGEFVPIDGEYSDLPF